MKRNGRTCFFFCLFVFFLEKNKFTDKPFSAVVDEFVAEFETFVL